MIQLWVAGNDERPEQLAVVVDDEVIAVAWKAKLLGRSSCPVLGFTSKEPHRAGANLPLAEIQLA